MKVPVEWLNTYFKNKQTTKQVAGALERAGVEVEEVASAVALDPKIVVGLVTDVKPHPNADKLRIVTVELPSETLEIVCGASNLALNQHVPVATVGAKLPDGTIITGAKLRGIVSNGMICSEQELGLSQNHEGIMVFPDTTTVGQPVKEIITTSDVIDTTSAPNRWDLNGMVWLAHEAAAQTNAHLAISEPEHLKSSTAVDVDIQAAQQVPRYMLAKLKVDASKPSPEWLQQRLQAAGMRSVNVVVDITNYVMLEYSQPLHAFDASAVKLPVAVRSAHKDEKLVTLDGITRKLDRADLLIADAAGPLGLAGVMGGKTSEVSKTTTEIYLESASFDPVTIRHTAVRHGLRSDASARFERGIPVQAAPVALARAVRLLTELADGGAVTALTDEVQSPPTVTKLVVDSSRINAILGLHVSAKDMASHLHALQFDVGVVGEGELAVTAPWWRPDIQQQEDIAEEVIKLVGYEKLPSTLPAWAPKDITVDRHWPSLWQAKNTLRSLGLFEVVTYSFISEDQITGLRRDPKGFLELQNPLSIEQAYLRTDLMPSLLRVAERNRTYARRFGVFEFSKVYHPTKPGELPTESSHLGVLTRNEGDGYRSVKAALDRLSREFNVAVSVEVGAPEKTIAHPTQAATVLIDDRRVGWLGRLHPSIVEASKLGGEVGYLELDWEAFIAAARLKQYQEISRFPAVVRDLSVVVKRDVTWQQISKVLSDYKTTFLSDYYGPELSSDKKAVTVRLTISAPNRTLTDSEADSEAAKALQKLSTEFEARLRS